MTKPQSAEDLVIANLKAQHEALVARDIDALKGLLTSGFTRTHFSSKPQTRDQWLKQVSSREIAYHCFEYESIKVDIDGTQASMLAKVISDATLYGERKHWRMQLRQHYLRTGGSWLCSRSVASPW